MKRLDYETPTMKEIVVEAEDRFLTGSANVQNPADYRIENQKINTSFTVDNDEDGFADGSWE